MTALLDAARAALQAWEYDSNECRWHMDNLRTELAVAEAQPVGEPVAWMGDGTFISDAVKRTALPTFAARYPVPLFASPAADAVWNEAGAHANKLRTLLARYRDETPLGNQPHMIAHQADEALGRA